MPQRTYCLDRRHVSIGFSQQKVMDQHFEIVVIKPSESVRDLDVQLDSELSMLMHITQTASSCFFHLRLRQLKRFADQTMLQRLVLALILSRIDYCNAMLAGLPQNTIAPLRRVMNATIRLKAGLWPRDRVTESFKGLHWLPVRYRIKFKLSIMMDSVETSPVLST